MSQRRDTGHGDAGARVTGRGTACAPAWLAAALLLFVSGCADQDIETRLKNTTGAQYLAFSASRRSAFVEDSLARYTTWRFWDRPDLCEDILNTQSLSDLYAKAAATAGTNPLVFNFVVLANDTCMRQRWPSAVRATLGSDSAIALIAVWGLD